MLLSLALGSERRQRRVRRGPSHQREENQASNRTPCYRAVPHPYECHRDCLAAWIVAEILTGIDRDLAR